MYQLIKGQKIKLTDLVNTSQFTVSITTQVSAGVMDYSCFGVNEKDLLSDDRYFVFYNQINAPDNSISMITQSGTTEFKVDLKKLPYTIKKLVFVVTGENDITMKNITSGLMKLSDNGQSKGEYQFSGNMFNQEKAIILMELYEKDGIWKLSIVASGYNGGLNTLLAHFGGEEVKPEPQPIVTPVKKIVVPEPIKNVAPVISSPISLNKLGDSQKINLSKNNQLFHANLNWNTSISTGFFGGKSKIDLDLACMFILKNGYKGVIQALGNQFGNQYNEPYIYLDKDDRTGTSQNGENMFFMKPELIDFVIVFAFIYEGSPNWKDTNATVTLYQSGSPDIRININSQNKSDRFCVIASMENKDNHLTIKREERYFTGHKEVDNYYGFGFNWRAGHK